MGVYLIGMHLIGVYFHLNGFSLHWRGAGVRLARPTFRSFAHLPPRLILLVCRVETHPTHPNVTLVIEQVNRILVLSVPTCSILSPFYVNPHRPHWDASPNPCCRYCRCFRFMWSSAGKPESHITRLANAMDRGLLRWPIKSNQCG
jgi:hypothetical protein